MRGDRLRVCATRSALCASRQELSRLLEIEREKGRVRLAQAAERAERLKAELSRSEASRATMASRAKAKEATPPPGEPQPRSSELRSSHAVLLQENRGLRLENQKLLARLKLMEVEAQARSPTDRGYKEGLPGAPALRDEGTRVPPDE